MCRMNTVQIVEISHAYRFLVYFTKSNLIWRFYRENNDNHSKIIYFTETNRVSEIKYETSKEIYNLLEVLL